MVKETLRTSMGYARILIDKAYILHEQGHLTEALNLLEEVIAFDADNISALQHIALLYSQKGNHHAALKIYQHLNNILPGCSETLMLLGVEFAETGNFENAVNCFLECLKSEGNNATLHLMAGIAFDELDKRDEALHHFGSAFELNPEDDTTLTHLAKSLISKLRMTEAEQYLITALKINPANALAFNNLGRIYKSQGKSAEAVEAYRNALKLDSQNPVVVNNLLLCLNYLPNISPEAIFSEHQKLCNQVYHVPHRLSEQHSQPANGKLRIGYVSGDFHNHSVAFFFEPVLLHHDRQKFAIFCYSNDSRDDDTTKRLKATGTEWRSIVGLSDEQAAEKVIRDEIDILVDLSGHSSENRLGLFALKPAPLQVSWLGYPHSTGLSQMDYYLTDSLCDPSGMTEHLYTEKLIRLPGSFCCYLPPLQFPVVKPPPAASTGIVTFGSFNNFAKVNDTLIELWAEILSKVPGSRLFLKSMALGDQVTQKSVLAKFQSLGISTDRIALLSVVKSALDHLALYAQIDIALDTYPYHGTTTTCEALWMGVPVVTLAGSTHAARVGVSLLTTVGCQELISVTANNYINIAVELARDLNRLCQYRVNLRTMMAHSPLMDANRLTRNMESAVTTVLQQSV
jgi:predicted O-linked N-acetylglucosamine transferase (SPINDLY family)